MPQPKKKGRGVAASLATFAVFASLLAVGASPAAAVDEDSEADYPAEADACVGAALEDRGFTDVDNMNVHFDAINCLAHYRITVGCGDGTGFCPSRTVTRWQMALFLHRAAEVAGIDLGEPEEQGFTDIGDSMLEAQRAINDLAGAGIMHGVSNTEFDPSGDVPRKDMAVFLANFVDAASDVVTRQDDGTYRLGAAEEQPNDRFCDAYRTTPRHVDSAISTIYELGITVGKNVETTGPCAGELNFDPNGLVSRAQMASFITRTLGHTNARPAGLTAQNDGGNITVSIRDSQNAPVVNMAVDAFYVATDRVDAAFGTDGECSRRVQSIEGLDKCEIDLGDPVTQSDGNVELNPIEIGEDGVTVWVWAGDDGDEFDEMSSTYFKLEITPDEAELPMPTSASVTSDQPEGATHARYGTTVTFTIQLQGTADGDKVDVPREKGVDGEVRYSLSRTTYHNPTVFDTATGNEGNVDTSDPANAVWARTTNEVEIGRDGSATFTVTASDPDPMASSDADVTHVVWALTGGGTVIGANTTPLSGTVIFTEANGVVTNIEIEAPTFVFAPSTSGASSGNSVTVTVTDQYGNPVRGAAITLTSDGAGTEADADVPTRSRVTNRNGEVRMGYRYSGGAGVETLTATWDPTPDVETDDPATTDVDETMDHKTGTTEVYWANITDESASQNSSDTNVAFNILNADVDDNEIVADSADSGAAVMPVVVYYDSNDYFDVVYESGHAMADEGGPVSYDYFSEALADALAAYEDEDDENADRPTIQWTSYVSDDKSDIARFTLTVQHYS